MRPGPNNGQTNFGGSVIYRADEVPLNYGILVCTTNIAWKFGGHFHQWAVYLGVIVMTFNNFVGEYGTEYFYFSGTSFAK